MIFSLRNSQWFDLLLFSFVLIAFLGDSVLMVVFYSFFVISFRRVCFLRVLSAWMEYDLWDIRWIVVHGYHRSGGKSFNFGWFFYQEMRHLCNRIFLWERKNWNAIALKMKTQPIQKVRVLFFGHWKPVERSKLWIHALPSRSSFCSLTMR